MCSWCYKIPINRSLKECKDSWVCLSVQKWMKMIPDWDLIYWEFLVIFFWFSFELVITQTNFPWCISKNAFLLINFSFHFVLQPAHITVVISFKRWIIGPNLISRNEFSKYFAKISTIFPYCFYAVTFWILFIVGPILGIKLVCTHMNSKTHL